MAAGYTLHWGHWCADYARTWLGRRVEL